MAKLWRYRELCGFLDICLASAKKLVAAGEIPSLSIGRSRRFDPEQVKAWVSAQSKRTANAEVRSDAE